MLIIVGRGTQCLLGQVLVLYLHHVCAPVSVHTRANQGYEREGELRFHPVLFGTTVEPHIPIWPCSCLPKTGTSLSFCVCTVE